MIFSLPKAVKAKAAKRAKEEGVSLSMVLSQAARAYANKELSLGVSVSHNLRPEVGDRIKKARDEYTQGKNISPKFSSTDEGIDWLTNA